MTDFVRFVAFILLLLAAGRIIYLALFMALLLAIRVARRVYDVARMRAEYRCMILISEWERQPGRLMTDEVPEVVARKLESRLSRLERMACAGIRYRYPAGTAVRVELSSHCEGVVDGHIGPFLKIGVSEAAGELVDDRIIASIGLTRRRPCQGG
jgi:hypothetical protein